MACIIAITNEVWLKTLYNRGTDPQLSFSLVEYGVIRRRPWRILKNYLHLHRHLHRRILGRNLVLHAQSHRETFSRNPHIYQTYMQKFRSLLRYQPNHIFNPYPAFRHHRILPRVPPWIPHLTEWSGPSLDYTQTPKQTLPPISPKSSLTSQGSLLTPTSPPVLCNRDPQAFDLLQ